MSTTLSMELVDDVTFAAHRIELYGHLIVRELESEWTQGDLINEGLSEMVMAIIGDAQAIKSRLLARHDVDATFENGVTIGGDDGNSSKRPAATQL